MKTFLKKSLIYLVATMLAIPGALTGGYLSATKAKGAASDLRSVVINELMWMGSGKSSSDEWIELYNTTSVPVEIGGWKIVNAATSSSDLTIPAGAVIAANGYYLISNYSASSASSNLNVTPDFVTSSVSLSNDLDKDLYLKDAHNTTIDTVDGVPHWPAGYYDDFGLDRDYYSMSRKLSIGDGDNPSNWFTSDFARGFDVSNDHRGTPKSTNGAEITIAPYSTDWTNGSVIVHASSDHGSLNAFSHRFSANGSFTFSATTAAGMASKTVTISNIDTKAPEIIDLSDQTVTTGEQVIFSADVEEKNLNKVTISINEGAPISMVLRDGIWGYGDYNAPADSLSSIDYEIVATDLAGNSTTLAGVVTVTDNDAPIISSVVSSPDTTGDVTTITIKATDNIGIVKSGIIFNGAANALTQIDSETYQYEYRLSEIDPSTLSYIVWFEDENGNRATSDKEIVPKDDIVPVITLLGNKEVTIIKGATYSDAGVAAKDNFDGDITKNVVATNPVDINTVGDYTISYNVKDAAGNLATTVTRLVHVVTPVAVTAPIVTPTAPTKKTAPKPTVTAPTPATTPSTENSVQTPSDSQGIIKGAESTNSSDEKGTNWTPWIILFVLIVLAGAVTGGYYYWFAGKEEQEKTEKDLKKIEKNNEKTAPKVIVRDKSKPKKKPNRW